MRLILWQRISGGIECRLQTDYGDEYVAWGADMTQARRRLARVTGRSVQELQAMEHRKF